MCWRSPDRSSDAFVRLFCRYFLFVQLVLSSMQPFEQFQILADLDNLLSQTVAMTLMVYCLIWKIFKCGPNYSVSQIKVAPWGFLAFFPKQLWIFRLNFTCLLHIPIYARLQIFIQLTATLMKLCHIKHDHPVHIICTKCPPLAETHAVIFWRVSQAVGNF